MKLKIVFLASFILFLAFFTGFTTSVRKFREFVIGLPEEIFVSPGDEVIINGTILNTGWWWLHDFNLTVTGLPKDYNYTVEPKWFEHVRILREWNPQQGVYRVPEKFSIIIKTPENASGIYLINVTGQEFQSWKRVSNSSLFILRVKAHSLANFTITDIVVPETVVEFTPFNISFSVNNTGLTAGQINISVEIPEDWNISEKTKSLTVEAGGSLPVEFEITPTNTSGQIVIFAEYPYRETILNITKVGPILIPVAMPTEEAVTDYLAVIKELSPYMIILSLVFLAIIVWNLWGIYKFRAARKKEEKMPKKAAESFVS
ncbi:MAG: hypothetical protein QMD12_02335 [Candidatus Aenigmarchaeota archaeon]|nr:hypothetical protein [Candidatus Aenigmarchaeota archaeon]